MTDVEQGLRSRVATLEEMINRKADVAVEKRLDSLIELYNSRNTLLHEKMNTMEQKINMMEDALAAAMNKINELVAAVKLEGPR